MSAFKPIYCANGTGNVQNIVQDHCWSVSVQCGNTVKARFIVIAMDAKEALQKFDLVRRNYDSSILAGPIQVSPLKFENHCCQVF